MNKRGIAIINNRGLRVLAKIIEREDGIVIVAILPRITRVWKEPIQMTMKELAKREPFYIDDNKLNDELRTILEG